MIIDGNQIAEEIYQTMPHNSKKTVGFISFRSSVASKSFIAIKMRAAERIGLSVSLVETNSQTTEEAITFIKTQAQKFDGIVVQLPIPEALSTEKILKEIPKAQDIDVLGSVAKESFKDGTTERNPPVAGAVWHILEKYVSELKQKKIVLLGKGRLVGEPLSLLFTAKDISFQSFSKKSDQGEMLHALKEADVVITGLGTPYFVKPDMIKDGATLIDAGTSEQAGKLAGDIDPTCADKTALYTPVPGGIGPITVAMLYKNLFL